MLPSRKGQGGAAILIALIAALIILYVLFLPPADRAALLGEGQGTPGEPGTPGANIIYSSPVGEVLAPVTPIENLDLQTINLRAIEQGNIIARRDTALAENNVFEKKIVTINFPAQPELTRNAILSMNLQSYTGGNLVIRLNGNEIYNRAPSSRTFTPTQITGLAEYNTLELEVSSVGFAFWRTNRIAISDLKVTADVTDLSQAAARQTFVVKKDSLQSVDRIYLTFVPICLIRAPITISLNGAQIYEGAPDCENLNTLELAPSRLQEGENVINWNTRSADMLIDLGRVTVSSQAQENRVFTFNLDPAAVQGRPIMMRVYFANGLDKKGYAIINGNRLPIQGGSTYGMPVTTALRPGANTISFEALGDKFEIVRFEIIRG